MYVLDHAEVSYLPSFSVGCSELSVRFHNWNGVYIWVLCLGSKRRLQLVLHSLALCDVVTLWVESVFILDHSEGLAVFLEFLLGFIAVFSFFHRVGTGHVFLYSIWRSPSVGYITCRMFFPSSFAPCAFSFAGSVTRVVCSAFCCRILG